jgi:hypothetical protein
MRETKAEAQRAFVARCSDILAIVTGEPRITLDSTQDVLRHRLGSNALAAMTASNPGAVVPDRGRCWTHPNALRVHQPTPESLALLAELAPEGIRNRCDIAIDLPTATEQHARIVTGFIGHHWTSPRRARRALATVYLPEDADEDEPEPVAYYLDRPWVSTRNAITYAKEIDGLWFCRIEPRLFRAHALRRYGLDRRSMLTPEEVRAFLRQHLDHVLRLSLFYDPERYVASVERMVERAVRSGRADDPDEYRDLIYRTLIHALAEPPNYDLAPDVDSLLARFEAIPCQQVIDANPLLARDSVLHLSFSTCLIKLVGRASL